MIIIYSPDILQFRRSATTNYVLFLCALHGSHNIHDANVEFASAQRH